jgi:hypothetical protein
MPLEAGLLQAMLDPTARAIANAPIDGEPVTEATNKQFDFRVNPVVS